MNAPATFREFQPAYEMIHWETCKEAFKFDGGWLDVYIFETAVDDWRRLLEKLQINHQLQYSVDGRVQPFPDRMENVFEARSRLNAVLSFYAGNILVNCHFFTEQEIEFDLDPRMVTSQAELNHLLNLLQQMGDAVGKPVVLTPENVPELPVISYDSNTKQFQYHQAITS